VRNMVWRHYYLFRVWNHPLNPFALFRVYVCMYVCVGFQLHCADEMHIPGGLLPRYATNQIHNGVNDCWDDMGYYMFTLRDPVSRLMSWFAYEKPGTHHHSGNFGEPLLYLDCPYFRTLNDLVEIGLGEEMDGDAVRLKLDPNVTHYRVCRGRAAGAVTGTERFGYHAFFNYQYYYHQLKHSRSTITAIRQEHMVDDWNSMEKVLGGRGHVKEFPNKNKSEKDPADDYLSDKARGLLCNALCDEIQMYKFILRSAVNLSPEDVAESLRELRASCPVQAEAEECRPARRRSRRRLRQ